MVRFTFHRPMAAAIVIAALTLISDQAFGQGAVQWEGDPPIAGVEPEAGSNLSPMTPAASDLPGLLAQGYSVISVVPWGRADSSMIYLSGGPTARNRTATCVVRYQSLDGALHQMNRCFVFQP